MALSLISEGLSLVLTFFCVSIDRAGSRADSNGAGLDGIRHHHRHRRRRHYLHHQGAEAEAETEEEEDH